MRPAQKGKATLIAAFVRDAAMKPMVFDAALVSAATHGVRSVPVVGWRTDALGGNLGPDVEPARQSLPAMQRRPARIVLPQHR
jgi:hypothetical protein